ncbi:hypothetical protein [Streptomyces sp. NPDC001568]|uniref:hypothetical protein n=1 Tax=Streptomyces sp. NPDC001568 TaxID=3364588 RepID=UPI0036C72BCA
MLGVQVAQEESAAVHPDDGAPGPARAVDPHPHRRIGGHRTVLDVHVREVRRGYGRGRFGEVLARGHRIGEVGAREQR